jgi:PAS domain S-box-containing protein
MPVLDPHASKEAEPSAGSSEERIRNLEQELEQYKQRFAHLTELSADWYWEQDEEFRFTYFSGFLKEKTGLGTNWHLGKHRWDTPAQNFSEEDWARHKAALVQHEPFQDLEIQRVDSSGREIWSVLHGRPFFDGTGRFKGYRGVGRDVTASKLAARELAVANHALQEANNSLMHEMRERTRVMEAELRLSQKLEAIGQLAAGIAHEINTPMQYIGDNAQFLKSGFVDLCEGLARTKNLCLQLGGEQATADLLRTIFEELDIEYLLEQAPKALKGTLEGVGRVTTIVRALKDFAHPDQREKTSCDINSVLETALIVARNEYKYVAEVETAFGELPLVFCHVGEINQVFLNLLVNAGHAIGEVVGNGGGKGLIRIETASDESSVTVKITDSGCGIPPEVQDKIFEPFFTTKAVGKGTGQGLAIARSIVVDKHRGTLTFQSRKGHGTTFSIRLPCIQSPSPSRYPYAGSQPPSAQLTATGSQESP